jgi:cytidylate kinase
MSGIIAISGKSGCGNSTVTAGVAAKLGFNVVNYTFKNLAVDEGRTFEEIMELSRVEDRWDHAVDRKQVELARRGSSVVGSRLAIWLLKDIADLRIYLWASPSVRAERVMRREGRVQRSDPEYTKARDESDHERYLRLYSFDNDDFVDADLVINTERFDPESITTIICNSYGLRQSGVGIS